MSHFNNYSLSSWQNIVSLQTLLPWRNCIVAILRKSPTSGHHDLMVCTVLGSEEIN